MAAKQLYVFKPDYVTPYPASFWNNLEAQYREQLAKVGKSRQMENNLK